ncbi:MAG: CoA-binding protein, partial [Candidatus Zixiibacteriota bacterium]
KVDGERVAAILTEAAKDGTGAVVGEAALQILDAYGIPVAGYLYADSPARAVAAAKKIGYPVVMKIASPSLLHKTEIGAVMVDLRTDKEIKDGFAELKRRAAKVKSTEPFSVALQRMVPGGVETVIGMTTDPSFGPLVMFGLGGIYVEVLKDVTFRINPLTTQDAKEMIRQLRSYPLLTGFRGAPAVNLTIIEEALLRVSQLVRDFQTIAEVDINPFIVSATPEDCRAVDARFIVRDTQLPRKKRNKEGLP